MSALKAGETKRCEACGEPLIGAQTKAGNVAPITLNPKEDGNVLLYRPTGDENASGTVAARVMSPVVIEYLRDQGVPLRLNHFADCPERERFKGRAS